MLYIKDYQSLSDFVQKKKPPADVQKLLKSMIGKQVTVFTESGQNPFSGFLLEAEDDYVLLIIRLSTPPRQCENCKRYCNQHCNCSQLSTRCKIKTDFITAVFYNFI